MYLSSESVRESSNVPKNRGVIKSGTFNSILMIESISSFHNSIILFSLDILSFIATTRDVFRCFIL